MNVHASTRAKSARKKCRVRRKMSYPMSKSSRDSRCERRLSACALRSVQQCCRGKREKTRCRRSRAYAEPARRHFLRPLRKRLMPLNADTAPRCLSARSCRRRDAPVQPFDLMRARVVGKYLLPKIPESDAGTRMPPARTRLLHATMPTPVQAFICP